MRYSTLHLLRCGATSVPARHPSATVNVCGCLTPTALADMTPLLFIPANVAATNILFHIRLSWLVLILDYLIALALTLEAFRTSIMDSTPESFRRPSAMGTSLAKEEHSTEASSVYLSPAAAITPQGPGYPTAGLIGLGISGLDDMGSFPSALPYSVSPAISNQISPLDHVYSMPLKVGDYTTYTTTTPFSPVYNGLPAAAQSPPSAYDSQAMSASSSYNSSLEAGTGQNTQSVFSTQVPGYWTSASGMGSTRVPDPVFPEMENPFHEGQWCRTFYDGACMTVDQMALPVDSISHSSTSIASEVTFSGHEQIPTLDQTAPSPQNITSSKFAAVESRSKASKRGPANRRSHSEKQKGYACRLCGYVFTRRSNCIEHQKKHDPRFRESHPCNECGKTFGRKADLKRHTNNVSRNPAQARYPLIIQIHRGLRQHTCNWCQCRFSRPEALHK